MATETCVLFVNKCAKSKSLSKSIGAERARIFSHVQRSPLSASDESKTLPESFKHDQPTIAVWQLTSSRDAWAKKQKPRKKRQQRPDSQVSAKSPDHTPPQSSTSSDSSRSQSPVWALGVAEYDPFGTTAVPITADMKRLLVFYSSTVLDRLFVHKSLAEVRRRRTLAYAAEDAVMLYAMLCTASGILYNYDGRENDRLSALRFKSKAILHLKQELQKSATPAWRVSTVYAVALLLWVEGLHCDVEAVHAHTIGLHFLLSRLRETKPIPYEVMTTITSCHYYCSAMLQTRPTITHGALPMVPETRSLACMPSDSLSSPPGSLCSRFFSDCNLRLLGPDLPRIILDQSRCLRFKVHWGDVSNRCRQPKAEDFEGSYTSRGPVDLAFIDLAYKAGIALTPIQHAVRLAFFSLTQSITRIATPFSAFSRSMANQLCVAIDKCNLVQLWAAKESSEMLMWVVFVALHLSRGQKEWPSLITYMTMTAGNIRVESQAQMAKVLSGYVYSAKLCGETLDNAWRDVRLMSGANAIAI